MSWFNDKIKRGLEGRRKSLEIVKSKIKNEDSVLWMHAASLGEYEQGLPVLESMLPPSVLMKESHQKNLPLIHLASEHKLTLAYVTLFGEIESKK